MRLSGLFWLGLFGLLSIPNNAIGDDTAVDSAFRATKNFVAFLDEGDPKGAYEAGSRLLRLSEGEQDWISRAERRRLLLGDVQARDLQAWRSVSQFPNLPDGEYLLFHYQAQTTRKAKAIEIVLLHSEEGIWRVSHYLMK